MKKLLLAATLLFAVSPAMATTIDDPLHGVCLIGCTANAGPPPNISIGNPPLNFGFQASPGQLGPPPGGLTMDFLVPVTDGVPGSISVTGTMGGALNFTATLFSTTPWTSGQLDTYLGISASPTNVLDAFAASGAGFYVVQGFAGNYSIPQQGTDLTLGTTPLWSVTGGVPLDTSIVAFFNNGTDILATANSSALHAVPGPIVGAGLPGLLGLGMVWLARRRQNKIRAA